MENNETKFKWKTKNNGTIFGLCLVGVAALSVLVATGQVKQARKERENLVNEQAALDNELTMQDEITFMPRVDEALEDALEEPGSELENVLENQNDDTILIEEVSDEMVQTANAAGEAEKEEVETNLAGLDENSETELENAAVNASAVMPVEEIIPTVSFSEMDSLNWPVAGNVILDYSMDGSIYFPTLQQYKYNPALVIGSDEGAQVLAAAKGIVESIAVDNETGTTVTMNLGNGYKLKYGQLQGLTVAEGDVVNKGDLVGYVSQPTKYYCKEGVNLYFAMTKDEQPVDPILYLE